MEHIAGVVDRIRTIEARIRSDAPTAGFAQTLARAAGPPVGPLTGPDHQRAGSPPGAAAAPPGIALAQLLGRPLTAAGPGHRGDAVDGHAGRTTSGSLRLPVDAPLSSPFGMRVHPVTGARKLHAGIDLAAPTGTPIGAVAAGTVTFAGVRGGYGNLVIVDHGDGTETRYAHQDTIGVTVGQSVTAGQVLGTVGSTGRSTGPHLHLEFRRDGHAVDPAPLLGLR